MVAKRGNRYTIRLAAGNRISVIITRFAFKLGDKCQVAFDNSTGKVATVLMDDEPSDVHTLFTPLEESPSEEELASEADDDWSVLGSPEGEDESSGVLESGSVLGSQSFEGWTE